MSVRRRSGARRATYDDVLAASPTVVAEVVDGELHTTPRPALRHALAGASLGVVLGGPFHHGRGGPGGWWILDEPEVHLHEDVVVPDLAGWRRERLPVIPDEPYLTMVPDWVCEILSPSTTRFDRIDKLGVYAREDVGHAWLIDPKAQTLEVFRLDAGRWVLVGSHAGDAVVRAEPFDVIELDLLLLWGGTRQAS